MFISQVAHSPEDLLSQHDAKDAVASKLGAIGIVEDSITDKEKKKNKDTKKNSKVYICCFQTPSCYS